MIIFDLKCIHDHSFEGWFKNIEEYELQVRDGYVTCPVCDSVNIHKVPSAKICASSTRHNRRHDDVDVDVDDSSTASHASSPAAISDTRDSWLKKIGEYVEQNFDDVGTRFAEEAKRIHSGKTEIRNIKGMATFSEIKELNEQGITAISLPRIIDKKKLN